MQKRGQNTFQVVIGGVIALVLIIVLIGIINNYIGGGAKKAFDIGEEATDCKANGWNCFDKCTGDQSRVFGASCPDKKVCCKSG